MRSYLIGVFIGAVVGCALHSVFFDQSALHAKDLAAEHVKLDEARALVMKNSDALLLVSKENEKLSADLSKSIQLAENWQKRYYELTAIITQTGKR